MKRHSNDYHFTPGPWSIDPDTYEIESNNIAVCVVYSVYDYPCLDSNKHDIEAISKECLSNARLIAAAPDLLEACLRMVNADSNALELAKRTIRRIQGA